MPAVIDYRKCTGCKLCYNHCPLDVFTWDEDLKMPRVAYPEECWHCGVCWMECPKRAIDINLPASLW
jgi:adenylylsulfate reductase, subunit B